MIKVLVLLFFVFSIISSYAQDEKSKALDQIATCGALSYISTALYVPNEAIEKIEAFDSEAKKYLKNDQANLRRASDAFALRAGFFQDLYFDMASDSKLTNGQYSSILEKKYQYFKNTILNDDSYAVTLASLYPKCQAYMDALNQISMSDKKTNFVAISIKKINEVSKRNFVANDQQVGSMVIAGSHWKYMDFIRTKSFKEILKK